MRGKRVKTPKALSKELIRLGKETGKDFDKVLRLLALKGYNELVTRSATDTGFLRSNWEVTVNAPDSKKLENPYESGAVAVTAGIYPNPNIGAGDTVTIYNNTEYAMFLETGTANMEAQPMIQPTIIVLEVEARSMANRLSKVRKG